MHILSMVERHLRKSGTAATRFGRDATGDPRLVFDMRRGRELRPRTVGRVLAAIEAWERRATCDE